MVLNDQHGVWKKIDVYYRWPKYQSTSIVMVVLFGMVQRSWRNRRIQSTCLSYSNEGERGSEHSQFHFGYNLLLQLNGLSNNGSE
jgi:hypothetical protein